MSPSDGAHARCRWPRGGRCVLSRGDGGARGDETSGDASGRCRSKFPIRFVSPKIRFTRLRADVCQNPLARPRALRASLLARTMPVYRQSESGAFLLGQLRSRGHPLLRTAGTAARRARVHARGLLARGHQSWVLAGQRPRHDVRAGPCRRTRVLCVRGAGAAGVQTSRVEPPVRSITRSLVNSSCRTARFSRHQTPTQPCWRLSTARTRKPPISRMGSHCPRTFGRAIRTDRIEIGEFPLEITRNGGPAIAPFYSGCCSVPRTFRPITSGLRSERERRKGDRRKQSRGGSDRRQTDRRRAAVRNVVLAAAAVVLPHHGKHSHSTTSRRACQRPSSPRKTESVTTKIENVVSVPPEHAVTSSYRKRPTSTGLTRRCFVASCRPSPHSMRSPCHAPGQWG